VKVAIAAVDEEDGDKGRPRPGTLIQRVMTRRTGADEAYVEQ
jgi:hypothetical protein